MKKFKRTICAIVTCLAMTATFAVNAATTQATTPELAGDLTDITDAELVTLNATQLTKMPDGDPNTDDIGNGGWFNVGMNGTATGNVDGYFAPSGGVEKAAGGGLKLTQKYSGIARRIAENNPGHGVYQIEFSVKPNGSEVVVDATGTANVLCKGYPATSDPDRKRSVMVNISKTGNVLIPEPVNPIRASSNSWIVAKGDANKWYDVTALYYLEGDSLEGDSKKVKIVVRQDGKIIANAVTGVGGDINTYGLGYIRFSPVDLVGSGPVIKNVTIEECTGVSIPYTGYGDKLEYKSAGLNTAQGTQNAMKQAGWATTVADATNNKFTLTGSALEIASGGNTKPAVQTKIKADWENPVKGNVHFYYRIKLEGATGTKVRANVRGVAADGSYKPQSIQFETVADTNEADGLIGLIKAAGDKDGTLGTGDVYVLGNFDESKWLDVDEYIDTNTGKYRVVVKQDDAIILEKDNLIVRDDVKSGMHDIQFNFIAAQTDSKLTIDEVQFEKVASLTDYVYVDKTGDTSWKNVYDAANDATVNAWQNGGWGKLTTEDVQIPPSVPMVDGTPDYSKLSMVMSNAPATNNIYSVGYTFPQAIKDGTVTVEYDLKISGSAEGGNFWCDLFPENEGDWWQGSSAPMIAKSSAFFEHHNEKLPQDGGTHADRTGIGREAKRSFAAGEYHMKVEVVPAQSKYNVLVTDSNGNEFINEPGLTLYAKVRNPENSAFDFSYQKANTLKSVNFRSNRAETYIDNLVIAYEAEEAVINAKEEIFKINSATIADAKVTADVTAVNGGSDAKTLVLYAACYDADGNFINITKRADFTLGAYGTVYNPLTMNFDEAPTGVQKIKVFMWNENLKPYCDAYVGNVAAK